ncbi:hypothetical protein [Saccharibacillus qingshengii]|nr:hypothetical protein [Saccharibacillus qingshengii]
MTKQEKIDALRKQGRHNEAIELDKWRDKNGRSWGWNKKFL